MQIRDFHCKECQYIFPAWAAHNVAEELLFAQCPVCQMAVGLYRTAEPILEKPTSEWTFTDVLLLALVGYVGYKAITSA